MTGVWPPDAVPLHAWGAVEMYLRCESWKSLPADGGMGSQDSWTMAAFDVLESELGAIRRAIQDEERFLSGRR